MHVHICVWYIYIYSKAHPRTAIRTCKISIHNKMYTLTNTHARAHTHMAICAASTQCGMMRFYCCVYVWPRVCVENSPVSGCVALVARLALSFARSPTLAHATLGVSSRCAHLWQCVCMPRCDAHVHLHCNGWCVIC